MTGENQGQSVGIGRRGGIFNCGSEFFVGGGEVFGEDPGLGGRGHEIGVSVPARHDVHVQVFGNAGARGGAQVHSYVYALGRERVVQPADAAVDRGGHGGLLVGGEGTVRVDLPVGDNQQVAVVVGIEVHDDEHVFAPPENQILSVIVFIDELGEHGSIVGRSASGRFGHVLRAPGTPHAIHG